MDKYQDLHTSSNERSRTNKEAHGIIGYSNEGFRVNEKEAAGFSSKVDSFEVGLYVFMIAVILIANFA